MITSVSDARLFFHRNEQPIYFVSASPFNLLGIDTWVSNFKFINLIDCFDGRHPNVIVPTRDTLQEFESMEEINNHLLGNKEVLEYIRSKKRGQGVFLMFDDETEKLAKAAKLRIPFPRAKLRNKLDDKIETVKIGERAGVPSVPNVLARVTSYEDLCQKAESLGTDLVIQTAFGDSGHTTFFVSSKATWKKYADEITSAGTVKIMKRIKCRQAAIEACTTRCGTVVGPLMTEIVGFKELTPYRGGWAGNEISPNAFPLEISERARDLTFKFGEELHKTGYRGYFELDFLIDEDTDEVWLGELNPRVTGASAMTNIASFAFADMPLFLFHLLEFSGQDFDIDISEVNKRWSTPENIDTWSQLVIKHTEDDIGVIEEAPESGIYRIGEDGGLELNRFDLRRSNLDDKTEGFYLRISGSSDYCYEGADLGILITKGRLMSKNHKLTKRAKDWVKAIRSGYKSRALAPFEDTPPQIQEPGAFKII